MERVIMAFGLLYGVMLFSYIMGEFIEILRSYDKYTAVNDEGEELAKFFGILRNFN